MANGLNAKYSAAIKDDIYTELGMARDFRRLADLGVRETERIRV